MFKNLNILNMIFLVQTFKNLNNTLHLAERAHVGQVQLTSSDKNHDSVGYNSI